MATPHFVNAFGAPSQTASYAQSLAVPFCVRARPVPLNTIRRTAVLDIEARHRVKVPAWNPPEVSFALPDGPYDT